MKRAAIIFFIFVLLGAGYFFFYSEPEPVFLPGGAGNLDARFIAGEARRWGERIDKAGPEKAYEELKAEYRLSDYGRQHTAAHVFGELLYDKMGAGGAAVCDFEFGFGCYHSFFGKAISIDGEKTLPLFDEECRRKLGEMYLPCQHGIGHGILSHVGDEKLVEALNLCATISWRPTGGCATGVFMEYNFSTMKDPARVTLRPYDAKSPYAPCPSLPQKFQAACYFEQVQWWENIFNGDYVKMGDLCDGIDEQFKLEKESCFRGIGNFAAPYYKYDVVQVIDACKKMPYFEAEVFCRESAAVMFLAGPNKNSALFICAGLGGEAEEKCLQEAGDNPANSFLK